MTCFVFPFAREFDSRLCDAQLAVAFAKRVIVLTFLVNGPGFVLLPADETAGESCAEAMVKIIAFAPADASNRQRDFAILVIVD